MLGAYKPIKNNEIGVFSNTISNVGRRIQAKSILLMIQFFRHISLSARVRTIEKATSAENNKDTSLCQ